MHNATGRARAESRKRKLLMKLQLMTAAALLAAASFPTQAHDGRRLEIKIVDGQLVVQGYNSAGIDDGGGVVRPYYNSLHDHWHNSLVGTFASADLPGFDLFTPGPLVGHDLTLTLHAASKWVNPPLMPTAGTVPTLEPLGVGEVIFASFDLSTVSTDAPGDLVIASSISLGGAADLDLAYEINSQPAGVIYVLEFTMSTDAPGVTDSDTIYLLFGPDGANAVEKLHHASLYIEEYLGTTLAVPCPGDLADDFGTMGADGQVSFGDFLALLGLVGPCPGMTPGCDGDIADDFGSMGADGQVSFGDFLALLGLVGSCPS